MLSGKLATLERVYLHPFSVYTLLLWLERWRSIGCSNVKVICLRVQRGILYRKICLRGLCGEETSRNFSIEITSGESESSFKSDFFSSFSLLNFFLLIRISNLFLSSPSSSTCLFLQVKHTTQPWVSSQAPCLSSSFSDPSLPFSTTLSLTSPCTGGRSSISICRRSTRTKQGKCQRTGSFRFQCPWNRDESWRRCC